MASNHSKVGTTIVELNTLFKEEIYTMDSPVVRKSIEEFVPSLFQKKGKNVEFVPSLFQKKGKNVEFVLNLLYNDPKNVSLSFLKDDYLHTFKIEGLTNDQIKDYLSHAKNSLIHIRFFENSKDKNYGFLKKAIEEYKTTMENTEQQNPYHNADFEEPDSKMMGGRRTLTKRRQHRKSKTLKKTSARK